MIHLSRCVTNGSPYMRHGQIHVRQNPVLYPTQRWTPRPFLTPFHLGQVSPEVGKRNSFPELTNAPNGAEKKEAPRCAASRTVHPQPFAPVPSCGPEKRPIGRCYLQYLRLSNQIHRRSSMIAIGLKSKWPDLGNK